MRRRTDQTQRARTVGLVSSFVAIVSIGLTLLVDNVNVWFGRSVTRSERVLILFIAIAVWIARIVLRPARRGPDSRADCEAAANRH